MSEAEHAAKKPRAAIIVNPTKVDDTDGLRRQCVSAAQAAGWDEPVWIETSEDDPGKGQTKQALEQDVDIVFAAGGDGTVRCVGAMLVGTDVPLGLMPSGTGNLLARNLGVPHISSAAKAFATVLREGKDVTIDIGRVTAKLDDGSQTDDTFLIMSGYGLDGDIMDSTSEKLKKAIGWVAYPMSGLKYFWEKPERMIASFDGGAPETRKTTSLLIGNFGRLTGGVKLMPGASGQDGVFDAVWLSAEGPVQWASLTKTVMTGSRRSTPRVDRRDAKKVHAQSVGTARALELDGDVIGRAVEMDAWIEPQALTVRIPVNSTHPGRQKVTNAVASVTRRR